MFEGVVLWFVVCFLVCVFLVVFFLLLLTYLFFKSSSVFVSPMNSQTGIPSLAACLPGLRGISALQLRVRRGQHRSWKLIDLLKGHRASMAFMIPEISSVLSCTAPLSGSKSEAGAVSEPSRCVWCPGADTWVQAAQYF